MSTIISFETNLGLRIILYVFLDEDKKVRDYFQVIFFLQ